MYTALVLTPESREVIKNNFSVPEGWEFKAHHMTINMDSAKCGPVKMIPLGSQYTLLVTSIAQDDKVIALGVKTTCPSSNAIKHITLAVNVAAGGKPRMSNQLTNWRNLQTPISLQGSLQEVA